MEFKKCRYDYIIIWGNGLRYKNEIINLIRNNKDFEIIKIIPKRFKDIGKLVNAVYSYDYAPIKHLKNKIKYLYTTTPEVIIIFLKNNNPQEDYLGDGDFRHIESRTLKSFKEEIRNKFNERKNDRRSENHVIHASDNQKQTDYILKFLGFRGIKELISSSFIFNIPPFIKTNHRFLLHKISIEFLKARIIYGDPDDIYIKNTPLEDTPHYKTLKFNTDDYQNYIDKYSQYLTCDYSKNKFKNLLNDFKYPYMNNFVIVTKKNGYYEILDGLHRATILKNKNVKNILVMEVL